MLLANRQIATGTVREDFRQLVSVDVATVGLQTMKDIERIQDDHPQLMVAHDG